jgi:hypothetical protein
MHQIKSFRSNPRDLSYATSCRFAAPNLLIKEFFHIKRLFVFEHKIDGAAQFMGKDAHGLAFVVFVGELAHIIFGLVRVSEQYNRGLFNGPFQVMVADLFV